jgi:NAD(P)-dependent dehydrogenase (short-subunit alcohol dehydrogenase family)
MSDSGRDLTSGVAVVTGGASGFGRAIGDRCADHGFSVALLDIDGERAAAEASALATDHGVRSLGLGVDVGDAADVERAANTVAQQLGGADLVFSNVGVQQIGALERFSDEAWTWMLDVNVIGAARLGLAETLRIELAEEGITVSVIFPSGMMTRHLESSLAARPTAIPEAIAEADDIEALLASNPFISQLATAEDAAHDAVDEVIAGEPYIVTHGDLLEVVTEQHDLLRQAVERARLRGQTGSTSR